MNHMRIRMLHPEFFTDSTMAQLSDFTRLIFIGLWVLADREGRLSDNEKQIDGALLSLEKRRSSKAIRELEEKGRIVRYDTANGPVIQIVNFLKYQNVHPKEKPSKFPGPTTGQTQKFNGHDRADPTSTSTSTSTTGAEGAPTGRRSDPGGVRTQPQRRRVAPDGRAKRAASAPVVDPVMNPEGEAIFEKHFGVKR